MSDTFAFSHTLVIIMSSITAGLFVLSLFLERWLRHVDRIPGTIHSKQRTFDIVAIVMGIIGAAGLVILSIFDGPWPIRRRADRPDQNHETIHWIFAIVFIVFVALCALFVRLHCCLGIADFAATSCTCLRLSASSDVSREVSSLSQDHPDRPHLRYASTPPRHRSDLAAAMAGSRSAS